MTTSDDTDGRRFPLPAALRTIVDTVWSQGGQRTARRNAWQAVCADRLRAREREQASSTPEPPTARPGTAGTPPTMIGS